MKIKCESKNFMTWITYLAEKYQNSNNKNDPKVFVHLFFFFCGEESSLRKTDGVFVMQHIFIYTQGISVYQVFFYEDIPPTCGVQL